MTHQEYFKKYEVSVEQYGVLLVRLAFLGKGTRHGNKGYDVAHARIDGQKQCRIEVKSKVTETEAGKANVIHCNENKFLGGTKGMTHLVVVLVNP